MEIQVGTKTTEESNEFLRSLWAEMAKEFEKCAWHYTPQKKEGIISFGQMDIDNDEDKLLSDLIFNVSISYKKKGTINNIIFELLEGKKVGNLKQINQRIKEVVQKAKENLGEYDIGSYKVGIKSIYSLNAYEGKNFKINHGIKNTSNLNIPILAYDENQGDAIATKKINQVLDFLSVETNAPFWSAQVVEEKGNNTKETYQEDEDFIDGLSFNNGYIVISKVGKSFLDHLITYKDNENTNMEIFLNACHHFHTARRFHAQHENIYLSDYKQDEKGNGSAKIKRHEDLAFAASLGSSQIEIANTLYLSALEVITLHEFHPNKCKECGQPKFSIKKRVKEFIEENLDDIVAKQIGDSYDKRSLYLHQGNKLTKHMPTSSTIPLLDPEEKQGCIGPIQVSLNLIRDYTSYCLRNFYKTHLMNLDNIGK